MLQSAMTENDTPRAAADLDGGQGLPFFGWQRLPNVT
jgi:hypothetical protein